MVGALLCSSSTVAGYFDDKRGTCVGWAAAGALAGAG